VQPRVSQKQCQIAFLYVADVIPARVHSLGNVFIAALRPLKSSRKRKIHDRGEGPRAQCGSDALRYRTCNANIRYRWQKWHTNESGQGHRGIYRTRQTAGEQSLEPTKRNGSEGKPFTELDTVPHSKTIDYHDPKLERTRSSKRVSNCTSGSAANRGLAGNRIPARRFLSKGGQVEAFV